MKINRELFKMGMACLGLMMAAQVRAATTVQLTLADASTLDETGFTASVGTTQILFTDDEIGIYNFNVGAINPPSGANISSPFYSVCVTPTGSVSIGNLLTYTVTPLASATEQGPGTPPAWANPAGAPQAGIANAYYLFSQVSGSIDNGTGIAGEQGTKAEQAAAMALAMYKVLFNSTGYGAYASSGALDTFSLSGTNSAENYDYNADLLVVKNLSALETGYILEPPVDNQDMVLVAGDVPQTPSPVPEPTTVFAGLLLLLPFGISAVRIVRSRNAAARIFTYKM